MQALRSLREKIEELESEKADLLAKVEKLGKVGEEKARALEEEVATLRKEVESLKELVGSEVVGEIEKSKFSKQEKREDEREILEEYVSIVRCSDCAVLTDELFCPILGSYLSPDTINKSWECNSSQRKGPQKQA